ncbi:MAG: hypothetical protein JXQ73_20620 [Phycisphaerae bacterium]|nr:hypothetical protein [Phycisphaerae bacterium]
MRSSQSRALLVTLGIGFLVSITAAIGCSYGGYVTSGLGVAKRASGEPSGGTYKAKYYVDVMLDGNEGSREKATGDIRIASAVNTSPRFKFALRDPDEFGKITSVILNIHLYHPERKDQPFDASYVLALASQDAAKLAFKPDVTYDFSTPIEGVKVIYPASYKGNQDGTVKLPGGSHFCMTVTVQASRVETARVMFETK